MLCTRVPNILVSQLGVGLVGGAIRNVHLSQLSLLSFDFVPNHLSSAHFRLELSSNNLDVRLHQQHNRVPY